MQNKKSTLKIVSALLIILSTTGCSTDKLSNEDINTGIGAGIGSFLGSAIDSDNIVLTLASTAFGAYIGNSIGKDMDEKNNNTKEE